MSDEGGNLDQSLFELIRDDKLNIDILQPSIQSFWNDMIHGTLGAMLRGIANAFAPYIDAKFGAERPGEIALQIHRLMCLEAEQGFVEHTPHSHVAAPNWVFTSLLYIDDIGREDRGTTLYQPSALDFDRQLGNVFSGTHERLNRVFDAPFRRGALLAFFDGPLSLHGSTPFQEESVDRSRRIIRSHISLGPREVEHVYGIPTEDLNSKMGTAVQRWQQTRDVREYSDFRLDNDVALLRLIANQQPLASRRNLRIFFPALEQS